MRMSLLWLIVALPLAAFLAIVLGGRALPRAAVSAIGTAATGGAAIAAAFTAYEFSQLVQPAEGITQQLWTWIDVAGFTAQVALYLDPLSLVMVLAVTVVSFLILLYSTRFMAGDEGYGRFFAYMNLFVAMMLLLVLADNLLLLYLAWEGVGLCSYLLISFWQHQAANVKAGRKAFLVTRIGDTALAVGILLLFTHLGTLNIREALDLAGGAAFAGSALPAAALLILAGAAGKSAQLPLSIWLPDAMAGPTPVSALIHAATMAAAGVYLIARMLPIFQLAPVVMALVAVVGAATMLYGAFSAMVQRDLKRVLAYSTISQLGYMFIALGVGAAGAAIFHFIAHALSKSLLFLAAGAVALALHHQTDIFKMGGLRRAMPLAFWSFLIGAASLSALPLLTSGFFSKELILLGALSSGGPGGVALYAAGLIGSILTAVYIFRALFIVFMGRRKQEPEPVRGAALALALAVLAVLVVAASVIQLPPGWLPWPGVVEFVSQVYRAPAEGAEHQALSVAAVLPSVAAILGLAAAYVLFVRKPLLAFGLAASPWGGPVRRFWLSGWQLDALYDRLFVQPFVAAARAVRREWIDVLYTGIAAVAKLLHRILSVSQSGRLRWYWAGFVIGTIVLLAIVVMTWS